MRGNYRIVDDLEDIEDGFHISEELEDVIIECFHIARKGKRSGLKKIQRQIEKYPRCPQLKNYLTVWYNNTGNSEKSNEANRWLVAEHPDYVFGMVNLANEHLSKSEYELVPDVLGSDMRIDSLFPDRKAFHVDEVIAFLSIAIRYFAAIAEFDRAEEELSELTEVDPYATITSELSREVTRQKMANMGKSWLERTKDNISAQVMKKQPADTTTEPPVFIHPEINLLYTNGLHVENAILEKIISLPRISLLKDLEMVLQDSIDRYYFHSENWDDDSSGMFITHAIFILGELKAAESMNSVLNVLSQSEEYLEFYFGDFLTELLWEPVYRMISTDLIPLQEFICTSGIYSFSKGVVSDALEQVALHDRSRKDEVVACFRNIFSFFIKSRIEDNVIDSGTIGLLVSSCLDIGAVELLPEIRRLFELKYVDLTMAGTFEDVEKAFGEEEKFNQKRKILGIAERYQDVISTWHGHSVEEQEDEFEDDFWEKLSTANTQVARTAAKTGRNDPCPCGSGKKYKKCCL